jgi:hypothetical protein
VRHIPRRRRHVSKGTFHLLRPFFRFSDSRQAYILRFIGGRVGPVIAVPSRKPTTPDAH